MATVSLALVDILALRVLGKRGNYKSSANSKGNPNKLWSNSGRLSSIASAQLEARLRGRDRTTTHATLRVLRRLGGGGALWEFPDLVVLNLVVCIFFAEALFFALFCCALFAPFGALFCALWRPFVLFRALLRTCALLRSFALFCAHLRVSASDRV